MACFVRAPIWAYWLIREQAECRIPSRPASRLIAAEKAGDFNKKPKNSFIGEPRESKAVFRHFAQLPMA